MKVPRRVFSKPFYFKRCRRQHLWAITLKRSIAKVTNAYEKVTYE